MNENKFLQTIPVSQQIQNDMVFFLDKSAENKILEIGCFEGLNSVFFADNFLDNPNSSLTCVNPYLLINSDSSQILQNNFDFNISICENSDKITTHNILLDTFFENNNQTYKFIYISFFNEPNLIKMLMENSFNILEKYGYMWLDNYENDYDNPVKKILDEFLEKYRNQYFLINMGFNLVISKA